MFAFSARRYYIVVENISYTVLMGHGIKTDFQIFLWNLRSFIKWCKIINKSAYYRNLYIMYCTHVAFSRNIDLGLRSWKGNRQLDFPLRFTVVFCAVTFKAYDISQQHQFSFWNSFYVRIFMNILLILMYALFMNADVFIKTNLSLKLLTFLRPHENDAFFRLCVETLYLTRLCGFSSVFSWRCRSLI